jgi:hypothetical protein
MPGAVGFSGAPLPNGVAIQQNALNGQNTPPLPSQLQPSSGAAGLINQILTSPRPGGMNGLAGTQGTFVPNAPGTSLTATPAAGGATPAAAGQQVVGAGLAGVASTREQEGIKTYNQRTKYNEWEFVYDITKDPAKNGGMQGAAGAPGANGAQGKPPGQSTPPGPPMTGGMPSPPSPPSTGTTPSQ